MSATKLFLISPPIEDPTAFGARLAEACENGGIEAVLLRLAAADERTLVNRLKILVPLVQDKGAAAMIGLVGEAGVDIGSLCGRTGADGVHVGPAPASLKELRERLKDRFVGVGGLRTRDEAMNAGEAGVDYLLFGEPRADGSLPTIEQVVDRASWWAEIFETPCIAYAHELADIATLAATGAEFIGLGDAVWTHADGPAAAIAAAQQRLAEASATASE